MGAEPVFRWTAIGMAALMLGFWGVDQRATPDLLLAVGLFFEKRRSTVARDPPMSVS